MDQGAALNTPGGHQSRPLLAVRDLKVHFPILSPLLRRKLAAVYAVDGVSFEIARGESLGVVGESGCGKSTLGKAILKLIRPTDGTIEVAGTDITQLDEDAMRPYRRNMQMIFQDPYSSLSPRMSIGMFVGEPLSIHGLAAGEERQAIVSTLLDRVGISPEAHNRYPHEFSGGQRQRIGIARALALNPSLIVADEPISALDVSIQAQVLNLMLDLQEELGLSYIFISHDLTVVEHVCHRIAVMYLGQIVEIATKAEMFLEPLHPYTEALLSAMPLPDPEKERAERIVLKGDVPSPIDRPAGCHFHTRCPYVMDRCRQVKPVIREVADGRHVACHLHDDERQSLGQ